MTEFLKSNPLFYLNNQSLKKALFVDDTDFTSRDQLAKYLRRVKIHKNDTTKMYYIHFPEKIHAWLKELDISNIEFQALEERFQQTS